MKFKLLITELILNFCFCYGQKIEIVNIEKHITNDFTHYILYCELINNSDEEIVLPLPTDFPNGFNPNNYNYFFNVEVSPKNSIDWWEAPPYQFQEIKKLNIDNFIIAKPNEKAKFQINTEYIIFYNRKFNPDVFSKSIKLIYQPIKVDKTRNLNPELKNLKIYSKKIVSNKYKLKK